MQEPQERSVVVGPGEGEGIWFNRALVRSKAPGPWSGEAFSLAEVKMPLGHATALHTDASAETIYVLKGELLFHIDGGDLRACSGTTVAVRRGTPHAFLAVSETARFLTVNSPAPAIASATFASARPVTSRQDDPTIHRAEAEESRFRTQRTQSCSRDLSD